MRSSVIMIAALTAWINAEKQRLARRRAVEDTTPGGAASAFLQEDGTSSFLLEDGTSDLLMEE